LKLPRECTGESLVRALACLGYVLTRQTGSHMRVTTGVRGEHHVTVPSHNLLRLRTLHSVLKDVAEHHAMTVEDLVLKLRL
jgi:predicted RNA binding protein YcfA (HicA-like mRNA interferase family)